MWTIAPFLLVVGLMAMGALALIVDRKRRRSMVGLVAAHAEPRSTVRVLHDEEQLREAASRAARFERRTAEVARTRVEAYEMLGTHASISVISSNPRHRGDELVEGQLNSA